MNELRLKEMPEIAKKSDGMGDATLDHIGWEKKRNEMSRNRNISNKLLMFAHRKVQRHRAVKQ